jgi:hypothetical protein
MCSSAREVRLFSANCHSPGLHASPRSWARSSAAGSPRPLGLTNHRPRPHRQEVNSDLFHRVVPGFYSHIARLLRAVPQMITESHRSRRPTVSRTTRGGLPRSVAMQESLHLLHVPRHHAK